MEISVEDLEALGIGYAAAGDYNGDGWLTMEDVEMFLGGDVGKSIEQSRTRD